LDPVGTAIQLVSFDLIILSIICIYEDYLWKCFYLTRVCIQHFIASDDNESFVITQKEEIMAHAEFFLKERNKAKSQFVKQTFRARFVLVIPDSSYSVCTRQCCRD
jgi:hypothetical protein